MYLIPSRRHLEHPVPAGQSLLGSGSPDLIEAAGIVVTVQDVNHVKDKEGPQNEESGPSGEADIQTISEGKCVCM